MELLEVTTEQRPRRDSLPEGTVYIDDGCDVAPACLECPLETCRYDRIGGLRALLNDRRDAEIARLRAAGQSPEEIARRFNVSRRTVYRVLEASR